MWQIIFVFYLRTTRSTLDHTWHLSKLARNPETHIVNINNLLWITKWYIYTDFILYFILPTRFFVFWVPTAQSDWAKVLFKWNYILKLNFIYQLWSYLISCLRLVMRDIQYSLIPPDYLISTPQGINLLLLCKKGKH